MADFDIQREVIASNGTLILEIVNTGNDRKAGSQGKFIPNDVEQVSGEVPPKQVRAPFKINPANAYHTVVLDNDPSRESPNPLLVPTNYRYDERGDL